LSSAIHGLERPRPAILVVDDEPDVRALVSDLLLAEDYQVWEAANGQEALDLLAHGDRPDLILLDLRMPVRGGREVLHQLRGSAWADIPVVVHSADLGTPPAGAVAWLRKPAAPEVLLQTIARQLNTKDLTDR